MKANFIEKSDKRIITYNGTSVDQLKNLVRERLPVLFTTSKLLISSLRPLLLPRCTRTTPTNDKLQIEHCPVRILSATRTPLALSLFTPDCVKSNLVDTGNGMKVDLQETQSILVPQGWGYMIDEGEGAALCTYSNLFTQIANSIRPHVHIFSHT